MNKTRTTSKALKERYSNELHNKKVFALEYCTIQNLLRFVDPDFYTCGVYGWNYDNYYFEGFVINTGYRGMWGYSVNYYLSREYNLKAEEIIYNYNISYEEQKKQVTELLREYLNKAKEQA